MLYVLHPQCYKRVTDEKFEDNFLKRIHCRRLIIDEGHLLQS